MVVVKATVVQRDTAQTTMGARVGKVVRWASTRRRVGRGATTITTGRRRGATVAAKLAAVAVPRGTARASTVARRGASNSREEGATVVKWGAADLRREAMVVIRAMVVTRAMVVAAAMKVVRRVTGARVGDLTSREGGTMVVVVWEASRAEAAMAAGPRRSYSLLCKP